MRLSFSLFGAAAVLGWLAAASPSLAQQKAHHLEHCTRWGYIDASGRFGTSNTCTQPVEIQFTRAGDQRVVKRTLKPGQTFDTGLTREQIQSGWWMFTACPVGDASSIPFAPENRDVLIASKYECVRR
jgi:hypothetical protein